MTPENAHSILIKLFYMSTTSIDIVDKATIIKFTLKLKNLFI